MLLVEVRELILFVNGSLFLVNGNQVCSAGLKSKLMIKSEKCAEQMGSKFYTYEVKKELASPD